MHLHVSQNVCFKQCSEADVLVGEFTTADQLGLFPIKSGCIDEVIPVIKCQRFSFFLSQKQGEFAIVNEPFAFVNQTKCDNTSHDNPITGTGETGVQ